VKLAKLLNVEISKTDISASHRLPPPLQQDSTKTPDHQTFIARFINRNIRNEIYSKRKAAKTMKAEDFPIHGMNKLFVNENLTQRRKKLLRFTKQKAIVKGLNMSGLIMRRYLLGNPMTPTFSILIMNVTCVNLMINFDSDVTGSRWGPGI